MSGPIVQTITGTDSIAQLVSKTNSNFTALETTALARGTSVNYAGFLPPVAATAGGDDHHWSVTLAVGELPPASVLVYDRTLVLREDQFTYNPGTGEIVLDAGYTPGGTIALTYSHNPGQKHVRPPRTLVNVTALGPAYWYVPPSATQNLLLVDHGIFVRADRWRYETYQGARVVHLLYTPATPLDVSASWADDSAGMVGPWPLVQVTPPLNTIDLYMPPDAEGPLVVTDHGIPIPASKFRIDPNGQIRIQSYTPVLPYDMGVMWAYRSDGPFVSEVPVGPNPDGVETDFVLDRYTPFGRTVLIRNLTTAGTEVLYRRGVDFTLSGRDVVFGSAPAEGVMRAEFVVSGLGRGVDSDTVDGFHAVGPGADAAARAGKLVATDEDGKLPLGVVGDAESVQGFEPFSSVAGNAGTSAVAGKLPAVGPDGKLGSAVLPASPVLGATLASLIELFGMPLDTSTLSREVTYHANGLPSQVLFKEGATTRKTINLTFAGPGGLLSQIEVIAGGKTVTYTPAYSGDRITSVTKTVA